MNIFIDAYNLLKQLHAVTQVTAQQKHIFIDQLKQFARAKGHTIYLVYDGGELARPYAEHAGPLTIIHSGHKLSADDVIKQKMLHYAHEHALLVSDDRQLCDYLAAAGFAAIGTSNFYKLMQQDIKKTNAAFMKQGVAHKNPGYSSTPELDALMHQSGSYDYEKEDLEGDDDTLYPQGLSKKEKKLKKLVKKL